MNNQVNGHVPGNEIQIRVMSLSDTLKESAVHLKQIRRMVDEYKEFNRKALEFVRKSRESML